MADDKETKGMDLLALGGTALHTIQSSSLITKIIASLVIYGLATVLVFILFQKPSVGEGEKSKIKEKPEVSNTNNQGITNHGNQNASAVSNGSNSGTIAGIIINQTPPASEDQKKQQIDQLQAEIEELAENRNRIDLPAPVTILQSIMTNKYPHQLFLIVDKYYKPTILGAKNGSDIALFRQNYREFQEKEIEIENDIASFVGSNVDAKVRDAWFIYVKYFLFRKYGQSKDQIISGGSFLNYGITWDDAERVYNLIIANNALIPRVNKNSEQLNYIVEKSTSILDAYQ